MSAITSFLLTSKVQSPDADSQERRECHKGTKAQRNTETAFLGVLVPWWLQYRTQNRRQERENATTAFENDGMFGLRLAVNDAASSALLAGFFQDLDGPSRALGIEGSRRLGDNWLLSLELRVFLDQPENDPLASFRDDDYLQLALAYYF